MRGIQARGSREGSLAHPPPLPYCPCPLPPSQVMRGMHLMQSGLDGADVFQMIMRDPRLLFLPELEKGITQLR